MIMLWVGGIDDMKGRINKHGRLRIGRAGKLKDVFCPHQPEARGEMKSCGDWCPLFGEPVSQDDGKTWIELCECSWFFTDFEDQR